MTLPLGQAPRWEPGAEQKPIFLSIGYPTCHWRHAMARESFENPEIAALLNAHFVAIKIDREERPDVDRVYMTCVQAMTGSGGWRSGEPRALLGDDYDLFSEDYAYLCENHRCLMPVTTPEELRSALT